MIATNSAKIPVMTATRIAVFFEELWSLLMAFSFSLFDPVPTPREEKNDKRRPFDLAACW